MTIGRDESPRDNRLEAAWRAASREEPPPAIDAAILAAARRAVQSGPHAVRAAMPAPQSQRRAWWPLAAAAAIAAITVGVVQMAPPEGDMTIDAHDAAPAAAAAPTLPPGAPPVTVAPQPPAHHDESGQSARLAREPSPSSDDAFAATNRDAQRPALRMPIEAAHPAPPILRPRADSDADRPALAAKGSPSHHEARRQAAPTASPPAAAVGSIGPPPLAKNEPSAFPASPPAGVAQQPALPDAVPGATPSASPSRAAARRGEGAPLAKSTAARIERTSRAIPPFDEWVKTIQQLLRDGQLEDAKREVLRLRDAYPDREPSLPPELRTLLTPR